MISHASRSVISRTGTPNLQDFGVFGPYTASSESEAAPDQYQMRIESFSLTVLPLVETSTPECTPALMQRTITNFSVLFILCVLFINESVPCLLVGLGFGVVVRLA